MAQGKSVPELIGTLINIALSPGKVETPLFSGQGSIQVY